MVINLRLSHGLEQRLFLTQGKGGGSGIDSGQPLYELSKDKTEMKFQLFVLGFIFPNVELGLNSQERLGVHFS